MLESIKKYSVIIVIAVLFAFFAFSIVELVHPAPKYEDYCREQFKPSPRTVPSETCPEFEAPQNEWQACIAQEGYIEYEYDSNGCAVNYTCNTCQKGLNDAQEQHRLIGFIVTSILGIFAIITGLYVRTREEVIEWVFSGLIIGGVISIFIGTIMYFQDMGRFVKPFVFLAEIGLIIWIAVKTFKK